MPSADDVAASVIARLGAVEAMKLQKLVYYAQAWHLAIFDKPIFDEHIVAWEQGPVTKSLWRTHKGRYRVESWREGNAHLLDLNARGVIELVSRHYAHLSGDDLSTLTHAEQPWRDSWFGVPEQRRGSAVISPESMARFYRTRTLAGFSPADLAAGGVSVPPLDIPPTPSDRQVLEDIRADFGRPSEHPDQIRVTSAQFTRPPRSAVVARSRGQAKPARGRGGS